MANCLPKVSFPVVMEMYHLTNVSQLVNALIWNENIIVAYSIITPCLMYRETNF